MSSLLFEFPIVPRLPLLHRLAWRKGDGIDAALLHDLLPLGVHPPSLDVRAGAQVLGSGEIEKLIF